MDTNNEVVIPDVELTDNDFITEVSQETTAREIKSEAKQEETNTESDDFNKQEKKPADTENNNPASPVKKRNFSADFNAEMASEGINAVQSAVFTALQIRKQRKRYFQSKSEFNQAGLLKYIPAEQFNQMPDAEEKRILLAKYRDYKANIKKITEGIEFTDDELRKLKKSLKSIAETNPNFDFPPWLAFSLTFGELMVDRVVDLIMD